MKRVKLKKSIHQFLSKQMGHLKSPILSSSLPIYFFAHPAYRREAFVMMSRIWSPFEMAIRQVENSLSRFTSVTTRVGVAAKTDNAGVSPQSSDWNYFYFEQSSKFLAQNHRDISLYSKSNDKQSNERENNMRYEKPKQQIVCKTSRQRLIVLLFLLQTSVMLKK